MRLPLHPRDIPNIISVLRILLTLPVIYFLVERDYVTALWLFAIAGFSDGLDGFLAKHYHWQSHLGGLLDPLADKALLMSAFLVLGATGLIPMWLVVLAVLRDLVIVGGALYYHFRVEDLEAAPTLASKLNTLLEIILVLAVTLDAGPVPLPAGAISTLEWALVVTLLGSGGQYVWVWTRKALVKGWKE